MAKAIFQVTGIDQIRNVAAEILSEYPNHKILAFRGEMGVGKTTFIKALCDELGVTDVVNSPSFAIVNEYESALGEKIYHFDFYRLKNLEEAYDMGYEDYLYTNRYCFWNGLKRLSPPPSHRLDLFFEELDNQIREITIRQGE